MTNRRELRNPNNTFTTNDEHNDVIDELKKKSLHKNVDENETSIKFWLLSFILVVVPGVLIARSPIFTWNQKSLKASYIELPEMKPLEVNTLLQSAKYIGHKKLVGPETIVFAKDGTMYTGLMNGQIVKVGLDGTATKIVQIGEQTDEAVCNNFGPDLHSKAECGRPLGLRLNNDSTMYVADSYNGIFKVNLVKGTKELIFGANDSRLGSAHMKLVNDLDLDGDIIYFIDSSFEREVNEAIEEHFEALPRGRLFSYDMKADKLELLLENLYFPNGLQFTPEKDALLINENTMARIIKYYLRGVNKGKREIFLDLPGFGDTIRLTDKQTLLVPIAATRVPILEFSGKYPIIRHLLGYILNMRQVFTSLPKYGLLLEYDMNGKLIKSWQDPSGKTIGCVTSAVIHDKKIYLGSFYNDYLGVVDY